MRTRHALVTFSLAIGLLGACGSEIEVSPAEPASTAASEVGASPEVQRLVAEIDSMLVVPQGDYPDGDEFSAVFEQGVVAMQPDLVVYEAGKEPVSPELPKPDIEAVEGVGNISDLGGYFNEIRYFVDCILEGKKPQIVTPQDAEDSLKTVLAELESAKAGEEVAL